MPATMILLLLLEALANVGMSEVRVSAPELEVTLLCAATSATMKNNDGCILLVLSSQHLGLEDSLSSLQGAH